jgi:GT2 family glycosyltransferase
LNTNPTAKLPEANDNPPQVSVILLNYNGERWLQRCLGSLRKQTIFHKLEVIVADNASPDGSYIIAEKIMKGWHNGRVIQHGANLGFCEGNNRAARQAQGQYLFFLNNDTWLEDSCLESLLSTVQTMKANAGTPLMLNYDDNSIQSSGGAGYDIFGLMSLERPSNQRREIFVVGGCSYLIERQLFDKVGGFDPVFYMYADEYDLSWRVWISGAVAVLDTEAKLHHRGAAAVNPTGGDKILETRTSDTKRYYTNRNCLLLLLKNCQHILLIMVPLQVLLLLFEAVVAFFIFKRWNFVKRAYVDALVSCWKLRNHILAERRRIRSYRRRSDWGMLRFFRFRLNRWDELRTVRRYGMPKVTPG